jgi:Uma2 family endonuclease
MAAAVQLTREFVTLEEYLHTSYRPDCDFVDDHIEERNLGDPLHSLLQMELGFWFRSHREEWNVRVLGELRTRVSGKRVRIPDIAVVSRATALNELTLNTPPLIAIEILSPDDRLSRVVTRLDDFLAMGVEHVWLLDPMERAAFTYSTAGGLKLARTSRLELPDSPIYLDLPELFSALDLA